MSHDISDFTEGERRDLLKSLKEFFGEPEGPHYQNLKEGEEFAAKHIVLANDSLYCYHRAYQEKLDAFMVGYLAGVRDTDNQNAEDILEEYEGGDCCTGCSSNPCQCEKTFGPIVRGE